MPDSEFSDSDRDLMIRTVIGEADDQPPIGQAGVAHVILNRVNQGRWGSTPSQVVLAKGQFEPWSTRARELAAISPNSARYRKVAGVVDDVLAGRIPDPTGGATYFLQPEIVRRRRGGSLPDWASGPGLRIGDHVFYRPSDPGRSQPMTAMQAIDAAIGIKPISALAFADNNSSSGSSASPDMFEAAGFQNPASRSGADTVHDMFEAAGLHVHRPQLQTETNSPASLGSDAPPGAVGIVDIPDGVPFSGRQYVDASGHLIVSGVNPQPPSWSEQFWKRSSAATGHGEEIKQQIADEFRAASQLAAQGRQDISSGFPLSGAGKMALGGAGMVFSPVAGLVKTLVEKPVTELTGNPEIGQRAAFVAGALPFPGGVGSAAKVVSPATRATDTLVRAIGPENVPEAVARLRANPQLSFVDVSDPVRTMTQGLIDPSQPEAQRIISDAVKRRTAEGPSVVNSAYTAAMGPSPDVVQMVEWLKERAREAGRNEIEPALRGAKPVDTSPVIKSIDEIVKPGLTAMLDPSTRLPLSPLQQELLRLKQQLVTPSGETLVDARRLHDVQSRFGDLAYQLQKSADGKDRLLGSQLRSMNERLIDQIDAASGGAYRPARAKFKDAKDIHQAWEEGFDVLKNRSGVAGLEDRPEALAKWMETATPEEITAKRLGTRADIDQKIRGVRNQVLAGTNITRIEYNREKLKILFGEREANRLIRAMNDAADVAQTDQKLIQGSKTAETLAGQRALEVRKVGGGNPLQYVTPVAAELLGQSQGLPFVGGLGTMALKGAHLGWQQAARLSDKARNEAFARAAMASGPERDEVIREIMSHPSVINALQRRGGALTASPWMMPSRYLSYVPALF